MNERATAFVCLLALTFALAAASAAAQPPAAPPAPAAAQPPAASGVAQGEGADAGVSTNANANANAEAGELKAREWLPSKPFTFWNGRIVISGDASLTVGPRDDGYFNMLEYYHDAFSVLRLDLSASVRVTDRISVLGQVVDDIALRGDPFVDVDRHVVRVYALFLRVQPWTSHPFDVQAGRVPPVFGAFGRSSYGSDNPLIGVPLAYQYQTTLREDAVPANAGSLLAIRGRGWSFRYPQGVGAEYFAAGMPIVESQQWDSGVQVHWGTDSGPIDVSAAVTNGTLSAPQMEDNNNGKQVAGRVAFRPATGLVAGVSLAAGEYLSHDVVNLLPSTLQHESYTQRAIGVDGEYSRGYWLVRGESILSAWRVPATDPRLDESLKAWSSFVETKWRLAPRWYLAGRADHLGFSHIEDPATRARVNWDAPVTRLEAGVGYTIRRNIRAKVAYQYNWRDARVRREGLLGAQLVYWF